MYIETSNREYAAHSLFPNPQNLPDMSSICVLHYLNRISSIFGDLLDREPTYVIPEHGVAIERLLGWDTYDWFMGSTIVQPYVQISTVSEIEPLAAQILEILSDTQYKGFLPNPFTLPSTVLPSMIPQESHSPLLSWQTHPVVTLRRTTHVRHTWDTYLTSLGAKRRYKINQALKDHSHLKVRVVNTLTIDEQDWLEKETHRYWTELHVDADAPYVFEYAYMQILWGIEVSRTYRTWFLIAEDGSEILSICSFVPRGPGVYFNSFSRSATHLGSCLNIGTFMLAKFVEYLLVAEPNVLWFNPTTVTGFNNPEFNVYKRTVCNMDSYIPSMAVASDSLVSSWGLTPPVFTERGLVLPE